MEYFKMFKKIFKQQPFCIKQNTKTINYRVWLNKRTSYKNCAAYATNGVMLTVSLKIFYFAYFSFNTINLHKTIGHAVC